MARRTIDPPRARGAPLPRLFLPRAFLPRAPRGPVVGSVHARAAGRRALPVMGRVWRVAAHEDGLYVSWDRGARGGGSSPGAC